MADKKPLYGDQALARVAEFGDSDTIPRANAASGTLFDTASAVPFEPRFGLQSVDVQRAIEELVARTAGGRRMSWFPYIISRQWDRVARLHRVGKWVAGDSDGTEILNTHGTWGHHWPFGTFGAYDNDGQPHRDHNRLATSSGPDLVTDTSVGGLSSNKHMAGFAKFIRAAGTWAGTGWQTNRWVYPMGWTAPGTNGRFDVSAVDAIAGELTVRDPADLITTEASAANHEIRGTSSGASGHNSYAHDGLFLLAGTLDIEERIRFHASGYLENDLDPDAFVEIVLEPNPPLDIPGTDQFAGANRMRMMTGSLGATWTGAKRIVWDCVFHLGHANTGDEYHYSWTIDIEDVLSVRGATRVTGGFNFKETDAFIIPRFRVDGPGQEDIYDATFQATGDLRLEFQKFDVEPIH